MIKSNSKAAIERVKAHIENHIGWNDDANREYTLQEVKTGFMEWYNVTKTAPRNYQEAFMHWCRILPSEVSFSYWTDDQRRIVASWLENTPEEAESYDNLQVEKRYYSMIYMQISKMWKE